jgi:hypothetical protein
LNKTNRNRKEDMMVGCALFIWTQTMVKRINGDL